jgi:hypothetical protein
MANYEYKFVKIKVKWGWSGAGKPEQDYHQIILQQADEGWRLVQIFAPPIWGWGQAAFYELIFERRFR